MRTYLFFVLGSILTFPLMAQPTISFFSPASGPVGTTVIITGTNFNTTSANNLVFFGATKAIVNAATATSLTVIVPGGASYQPISVSTGNLTAFSSRPFIPTFAGGGVFVPSWREETPAL